MTNEELLNLAKEINEKCLRNKIIISTAESCTGGLLSYYLTAISGSSEYFEYGFITYSNKAKCEMLGVSPETLSKFGAVSEETAGEMASLCRIKAGSNIGLSISGIAGPGGGSREKPVGTVCFGIATTSGLQTYTFRFTGDRDEIRKESCMKAMELILSRL
jgi:nicotinamide-nucleotide amidase